MTREQAALAKSLLDLHDQLERLGETKMDHTTANVAGTVHHAREVLNDAIAAHYKAYK